MPSHMKLLLVEDDVETASFIRARLADHGHAVDWADDGRSGLFMAVGRPYDVLIIDRMLPGQDGLEIVRMVRDTGIATPILFLTTMGGIDDRVEGLEAGGDDYLVKPFAFAELLARLNALARRSATHQAGSALRVGDLEIDVISRRAQRAGQPIDLTQREFRLLEYLMRNAGQVATRTMLLEKVWDFHFDPQTNVVETMVSRLRAKINRGHPVELIETVRGSGYVLRDPA